MWYNVINLLTHQRYAGKTHWRNLYQKLAQETRTRNLHEKFDESSSQFLHNINWLMTCDTVRVTCQFLCWNTAVLNCVQKLVQKTCARLTDTRASFLYKTTCTSFWCKFVECVPPVLTINLTCTSDSLVTNMFWLTEHRQYISRLMYQTDTRWKVEP